VLIEAEGLRERERESQGTHTLFRLSFKAGMIFLQHILLIKHLSTSGDQA
jgi:hypothetical protein